MPSEIYDYIGMVLARLEQDEFGGRIAPQVKLSRNTEEDESGAVSGALEISIRTRSGQEPVIQREHFAGLRTRDEVDDMFARALSVLLMHHPDWPR